MARVLVLVWDIYCYLSAMHPVQARERLWKRKLLKKIIISIIINYSPWGVHQTILSGTHTPLAEVSTSHLYCSTSVVFSWLLPSSLLGGLLPLLVSSGDLLALGPHDLEFFSPLPLTPRLRAVGGTSSFSSFSPPPLQLSASQLPPGPSPLLPSLLSCVLSPM